jgi:hypothetical protein
MATRFDDPLSGAALGDDLLAVWLYVSEDPPDGDG